MKNVSTLLNVALKISVLSGMSLSLFSAAVQAQADSGSDILVASVNYTAHENKDVGELISLSKFQKITDTASYTNQPYFINMDKELAYTQSITLDDVTQMDTFIYNFETQTAKNLTKSVTSEYSPTPTPDGKGLSVIRVNAQGKQELWYLQLDSGEARQNLLPAIEPVGYHAWDGTDKVLLFVLGEPHTLRLASVNKQTDQGRVLDTSIGPSLWAIPGTSLFSYSKQIDETNWQLRAVDTKTKKTKALVDMPKGSYYYAWSPQRYAVTAVDNKLYQWRYSESGTEQWSEFADLSEQCSAGISRLSFSQQGNSLAMVCNRPAVQ
ncbi:MAG: Tol biopolymer transport system component [Glaciecola sp.]|jgi:Tol biopolymer transport system component